MTGRPMSPEVAARRRRLLPLCDGTRTYREIEDETGVDIWTIYADVTWLRRQGAAARVRPAPPTGGRGGARTPVHLEQPPHAYAANISVSAAIMLAQIDRDADAQGWAKPNVSSAGRLLGCHLRTMQRRMEALLGAGLIEVQGQRYRLTARGTASLQWLRRAMAEIGTRAAA